MRSRGKTDQLLATTADWPESWKRSDRDVPFGREIVRALRPFLDDLATSGLAYRTVRRHADNTWRLGGEIVRRTDFEETTPELADDAVRELLLELVEPEGGPLLHAHVTEAEQHHCDVICRKL